MRSAAQLHPVLCDTDLQEHQIAHVGTFIGLDEGHTHKMLLQEKTSAAPALPVHEGTASSALPLSHVQRVLVLYMPKQEALNSVGSSFDQIFVFEACVCVTVICGFVNA